MSLLTSSTRISSYTSIQRSRLLPNIGEVFVRVGQDVNPVQVIAQALPISGYYILRASDTLGVSSADVQKYLLVEPGATLRKGMPILRKPGRFGRASIINCPINGVLAEFRDGTLIMQKAQEPLELRAMMRGRVVSVIAGRGAVLETRGAIIQAKWDSGKDGFGKLNTVVNSAKEPFNADKISGESRGTVLIVGWISSHDDLYRLENSGVRGIIAGSMSSKICLTASSFPFPIFLTDGVGEQAMSEPIFQILHRAEGKNASLLTSRIGARDNRSEIIVPYTGSRAESPNKLNTVEVGDLVRVLRWNGGNLVGKVSKVDVRPKFARTGLHMAGADVELGSGERVFIPYTNLDLIS
jgi:hypothetical protein